jgi:predicted house-cleaning noncanonical NTP pyrophosphatase (MazG superfamily)
MKNHCFYCDKLTRDNIEEVLSNRGIKVETRKLLPHEKIPYLKKKINEEAHEAFKSVSVNELINELVDVWETMQALKRALQITEEEFEKKCLEKKNRLGGFDEGSCLCKITVSEDHPDLQHYLQQPEQYPQTYCTT